MGSEAPAYPVNASGPTHDFFHVTPASLSTVSPRPYPVRLPQPQFPGHFLDKPSTTGGTFRFGERLLYVANALTDQQIGSEETDDGLWAISSQTVLLATLDESDSIVQS